MCERIEATGRTLMASMAYSTWKRRPSGEKVLTPRSYSLLGEGQHRGRRMQRAAASTERPGPQQRSIEDERTPGERRKGHKAATAEHALRLEHGCCGGGRREEEGAPTQTGAATRG